MNAQLVILEGFNVVVSDEEIKEGDWVYNDVISDSVFIKYNSEYNKITGISREIDGKPFILHGSRKIIASNNSKYNLPSVDYNGFEEELDIIDVNKLAEQKYPFWKSEFDEGEKYYGFINGFKKSQSLNDKEYNQEDMKQFGLWLGENIIKFKNKSIDEIFNESPFKKSNKFNVEIEMKGIDGEAVNDIMDYKPYRKIPKITNNQIKITKIL